MHVFLVSPWNASFVFSLKAIVYGYLGGYLGHEMSNQKTLIPTHLR